MILIAVGGADRSSGAGESSDEVKSSQSPKNVTSAGKTAFRPSYGLIYTDLGSGMSKAVTPYRKPNAGRDKTIDIVRDELGRIRAVSVWGNDALMTFSRLAEPLDFLTTIELSHCDVREVDLAFLGRAIKNQRVELSLWHCMLSKKSLSWIDEKMGIERVSLSHSTCAKENLPFIARLADIDHLNLASTNVDDLGLKTVEQMNRMNWLILSGTNVSADALDGIVKLLPDLGTLDVDFMEHITADDVHRWRLLKPKLDIYCNGQ